MYYTIKNATGKEVGNTFPQVSCLTQTEAHQLHSDEFPKSNLNLVFELKKKATLTDVLSQATISADGLLVSEKFKDILNSFSLITHRIYPVTINTKKASLTYFWVHLSDTLKKYINYDASVFYWTEFECQQDMLKIKSFDDYLKKKQKHDMNWSVDIEEIALNSNFENNIDLFIFNPFDYTIYISEALKKSISENNITGLDIIEANNLKLLIS